MPTQPFSEMVRHLNRTKGIRYVDMQMRSNEARSSAWFNNVANGIRVAPPPPEKLADIAPMLGITEAAVAEMVVEEWYGVATATPQSIHVQRLEPLLDKLSDDDMELVEALVKRLAD